MSQQYKSLKVVFLDFVSYWEELKLLEYVKSEVSQN